MRHGRDATGWSSRLPEEIISQLAASSPLVLINGQAENAVSVLMEAGDGLPQAVEHLYALGHRRIAYVPGPGSSWANRTRLRAVTAYCADWDIELVVVGDQAATVDGGLVAAASVVSSQATAVIAYNDLIALGVQAGARTLGRHCPEDISIIGIDDLDVAAASEPGLTSVRVDIGRSGSLGLELLLEQIAGKPVTTDAIHLNSQLIVRGSTFSPRTATSPNVLEKSS